MESIGRLEEELQEHHLEVQAIVILQYQEREEPEHPILEELEELEFPQEKETGQQAQEKLMEELEEQLYAIAMV